MLVYSVVRGLQFLMDLGFKETGTASLQCCKGDYSLSCN